MDHNAKIILPEDMNKLGRHGYAILNSLGALATIAYSGAYLADLARRRKWEKRIENQLSPNGKKQTINIPDETPLVILNNQDKTASLLHSMMEARSRL